MKTTIMEKFGTPVILLAVLAESCIDNISMALFWLVNKEYFYKIWGEQNIFMGVIFRSKNRKQG
jgi:hypothetical protein